MSVTTSQQPGERGQPPAPQPLPSTLPPAALHRVRSVRFLPPIFVAAYAVAVTLGLPATAFTLAGGALFGFGTGLLLNWLGAIVGAVLAYSFAGTLCGEDCRALLGR